MRAAVSVSQNSAPSDKAQALGFFVNLEKTKAMISPQAKEEFRANGNCYVILKGHARRVALPACLL